MKLEEILMMPTFYEWRMRLSWGVLAYRIFDIIWCEFRLYAYICARTDEKENMFVDCILRGNVGSW